MHIWWNNVVQKIILQRFFAVLFLKTEEKPDIQEPLKIKIETTIPGVEDKPKPNPSPTRLLTTLLSSKTSKVEDLKELKEVGTGVLKRWVQVYYADKDQTELFCLFTQNLGSVNLI